VSTVTGIVDTRPIVSFFVVIIYGESGMLLSFKMPSKLKTRYSSRYFGKLDQEFLEEESLRRIERMLSFAISGM
jgi:hypothetical protein